MADQPQISADYRKYVSFSFPNTDPYYSTIQAAINSISDASPTKPYGVYIYPGKYQETITLKSYVSLIGAGIDDVMIKGGGSSPVIIGPASDSGSGQCFITNLTIDGNGKSAIVFNDTSISTPKTDFIINVKIMTTNPTTTQPGITVEDYQLLDCIELSCIGFPVLPPPPGENPTSIYFPEGIRVTKHGNLRMWQSTVVSESYCLDHSSSEYSETYNCILSSGGPSMQITSGNGQHLQLSDCRRNLRF